MSLYIVTILTNMALISFIAISAYLILIVGEVSFGQQAFFGIGAYITASSTALFEFDIVTSLFFAFIASTFFALVLSILTIRLSGLYFAVASLSFAELFRLSLYKIEYTVDNGTGITGPNGPEGFQNIRWIFENNVSPGGFLLIVGSALVVLILLLIWMENSKIFKNARLVGKDQIVAQSIGIRPYFYRVSFIGFAGGIAGFGGGLFALFNTYIEPSMFGIMLGVHGLAYSIIGGLGYPLGPLLGVFIDIGLLESVRFLSEYRMIIFGGLVAAILIIFPEGIISPLSVSRIKRKLAKKTNA